MAYLYNRKRDTFIELKLIKNNEKSSCWIKYVLDLGISKNNKVSKILRLNNTELYLDSYYEPEIPKLCQGLKSVINNQTDEFIFEPVDEKDFRLEFRNINGKYIIEVLSDQFMINDTIDWDVDSMLGLRMEIEKQEVVNFIETLQTEYTNIVK